MPCRDAACNTPRTGQNGPRACCAAWLLQPVGRHTHLVGEPAADSMIERRGDLLVAPAQGFEPKLVEREYSRFLLDEDGRRRQDTGREGDVADEGAGADMGDD